MKSSFFVALTICVALTAGSHEQTSRYDNINVEEIMTNERLMKAYMRCFLNEGKCTPDAAEMKKSIPDLSNDLCTSCTLAEKRKLSKVLKTAQTKYPREWGKLLDMYTEKSKVPQIEKYINDYSS